MGYIRVPLKGFFRGLLQDRVGLRVRSSLEGLL